MDTNGARMGEATSEPNTPYTVDDICGDTLTVWPEGEEGRWGYNGSKCTYATPSEVALALRLRWVELEYQQTIDRLTKERDEARNIAAALLTMPAATPEVPR